MGVFCILPGDERGTNSRVSVARSDFFKEKFGHVSPPEFTRYTINTPQGQPFQPRAGVGDWTGPAMIHRKSNWSKIWHCCRNCRYWAEGKGE